MSGHNDQPGSQRRRASYRAAWAAAATVILLALGACSTTTAATTSAGSAPTVASFGSGGHKATLTGAGSTFVAPFFAVAFAKYHQQHPGVSISYAVVGSGAGIAAFSAKQADFGASDVPMTSAEQSAARGGSVTQVPVALGGEGVAYNLNLPAGARLHLTGPVLARIFLGQITNWHDPAITALNPGINIPDAPITVVHRSDSSGTTYIFSNYLSTVSPAWAAKVGTSKTLNWPVGEGAEGNGSVAATVFRTPFSIGYVEQAYSRGLLLPFAAIRNQAGNYVIPSTQTVAAAAAQKPTSPRPTFRSSTSPEPTAIPSPATAGRSSTLTSQTRPQGKSSSPCWTGSPVAARPTLPRTAMSPCHHKFASSPTPCSSRSSAPTGHICWANRDSTEAPHVLMPEHGAGLL
jgi:phosphate transport system substrate-binding protein